VFKGIQKATNQQVAIKVIEKKTVTDEDQFRNEFKILMELDHPNIIKLYEIYETEEFLYLVQEYARLIKAMRWRRAVLPHHRV